MHPGQHGKSKGLQTALLCQYDVLCHVAKEYSSFLAASRYEQFGIGHKYDIGADGVYRSAASIIRGSVGNQN
jgi:hypothetical protein